MGQATPAQKTADKTVFVMVPKKARAEAKEALEKSSIYKGRKNIVERDFQPGAEMLTLKEVEDLVPVIDKIYPKSKFAPSQLQDTNDSLTNTLTRIEYHPRDMKEPKEKKMLAFVNRDGRGQFKIFINEDCEAESFDSMDLHEKGHVLYNHCVSIKLSMEQFKKELDLVYDTHVKKYFDDEVNSNPKNKDTIVKILFHEFSNIAQDMEINSKLFDNGEWIKGKKTMARSGIIVHLEALRRDFDTLSGLPVYAKTEDELKKNLKQYSETFGNFKFILDNIKSRIAGEEGDFQFCYPANKGWPEKLDWMTYMILLIKNIDDTMAQVMKNIAAAVGGGNGQGGKSKTSQDVLDAYSSKMDGEEAASGSGDGDGDTDDEDGLDDGEADSRGERSPGGNGQGRKGHGGDEVNFELCEDFDAFTKFLARECLGKKNRRLNSDVLYNSNRSKYSSDVCVPRRHYLEKWMPTSCTILIDISGSVNSDLVDRVVNSIVATNAGIDLHHSHIIFCDTAVKYDCILSKHDKKVYSGGGTTMANGIKYIAEHGYMKKSTDKLFIISDLEDTLQQWVTEANRIPGIKWAIGYNVTTKEDAKNTIMRQYGNRDKTNFISQWNRTFKTCFISTR